MASSLLQWEADPFFPAAEEVQNSADRMMSAFRNWRHPTGPGEIFDVSSRMRRGELVTAVDTVKWQIEEFERAVQASMGQPCFSKEASSRHGTFIKAIRSQVCYVENILEEAAVPNESQAIHIQNKSEDRDSLVDFLSGRISETKACPPAAHPFGFQLQNECNMQGSLIANENVEKGNTHLYSPCSKITLSSLSTSTDSYPCKEKVKDKLVHHREDKREKTVSLEGSETVRQKPGQIGRFSAVNYGYETCISSGPKVLPETCMSFKKEDDSTEVGQTCYHPNVWEAEKATGSFPSDSVSKRWTEVKVNCMEHLDSVSPFSVIQMLKGVSVHDLEQGPRIRLGNYQKLPVGHSSELETYEKERTLLWRKAVQFRLWMIQRISYGRTLQLISAILIVISFVGITIF